MDPSRQSDQQVTAPPTVPAQRRADEPSTPVYAPPSTPRRRRNWRLIIVVAAAALATLCAAGSLTTYVWYGEATNPNRSSPSLVVLEYLDAYLGMRDSHHAALFACGGNPDLPAVRAARNDLRSREQQYRISINVAVDGIHETSRTGHRAEVSASIALTALVNGSGQRVVEQWIFQTEEHDGWRVCDGHEVS